MPVGLGGRFAALVARPGLGHPRQRLRIGIATVISSSLRVLGIDRSLHPGQQVFRQCLACAD